ncbi:MAG TPA: hypothetical protein VKB88_29420 [Bryobacteraceae bacterium]|nr:hypothetical protein [Bryobacteraceae bacterium]
MQFVVCAALLVFATLSNAAPVLRLSTSALVVEVAEGANPAPQTVYALNIGDGTLAPSVSIGSGAPWLTGATVEGGAVPCTMFTASSCFPIQFTFNTANLARGAYSLTVTISDPNATDAPQTVTVTVQVGGPPPYFVDRYMAPGQIADYPLASGGCFSSNPCPMTGLSATTSDGGQWLSISTYMMGTLGGRYWTESVHLAPAAGMANGTYTGAVAFTGTSNAPLPVTMRLTTLPIAVPSTTQISLRLAQGGPAMTAPFLPPITITNSGMGTLSVEDVTAQGLAVSAQKVNGAAVVTVDPGSLAPGFYTDGSVIIRCNAANCPIQVPVSLQVIPPVAPVLAYRGVADNATFAPNQGIAPGDIAVVTGEQLSLTAPVLASTLPLPTTLGGATVLVNDVAAPLFYTSFGQIAFQMPSSITTGTAVVQVIRDGQAGNKVSATIVPVAPQIVAVTNATYDIRDATHPTKPGEALILWSIGLGTTNPVVPDGTPAPASPFALTTLKPQVYGFSNSPITVSFSGLAPGEVGLYQVIFTVPQNAPPGIGYVTLALPGRLSESVGVAVQ